MEPNEPTAMMERWLAGNPDHATRLRGFYDDYGVVGLRDEAENFLTANPGTSAIAEELLRWAINRTPRATRDETLVWICDQIDWQYLADCLRVRPPV